jgi:hypothetical protein
MVTPATRNRLERHEAHDGQSVTGLVRELRDEAITLVR